MSEVLEGSGLRVRLVESSDADGLATLLVASREHLEPWEPVRGDDYFTASGQRTVIERALDQAGRDALVPFVLVEPGGAIVGRITISNVVRGVGQFATLGYWVGAPFVRRGYATAAMGLAKAHAFGPLRLHRLEAGTLVHNVASQKALLASGFERYGLAPKLGEH